MHDNFLLLILRPWGRNFRRRGGCQRGRCTSWPSTQSARACRKRDATSEYQLYSTISLMRAGSCGQLSQLMASISIPRDRLNLWFLFGYLRLWQCICSSWKLYSVPQLLLLVTQYTLYSSALFWDKSAASSSMGSLFWVKWRVANDYFKVLFQTIKDTVRRREELAAAVGSILHLAAERHSFFCTVRTVLMCLMYAVHAAVCGTLTRCTPLRRFL